VDLIENVPKALMEDQGCKKTGDEAGTSVFNNDMAPCLRTLGKKPIN
jgi:hypothetical protein